MIIHQSLTVKSTYLACDLASVSSKHTIPNVTEGTQQEPVAPNALSSPGVIEQPNHVTGGLTDYTQVPSSCSNQDASAVNSFSPASLDKKRVGKIYKCRQCGKSFARYSSAHNHCSSTPFSWVCPKCGASINRKCNVRRHTDRCNKKIEKEQMEEVNSEADSIAHVCSYCQKESKNKNAPKSHIYSMHTKGEGTYECELCSSKFNKERYLKKHMTLKHNKSAMLNCDQCDFVCHSKSGMGKHSKRAHSNIEENASDLNRE